MLSWQLSKSLDRGFYLDCLEQALQVYGTPEIFNTDQGGQFISEIFSGVLKAFCIAISMDWCGRVLDNIFVERLRRSVKHEDKYLKEYVTLDEACPTAIDDGAKIVDKFSETKKLIQD